MTEPSRSSNRMLAAVEAIPRDASPDQLQGYFESFLRELRRSLPGQRPMIIEALENLRESAAIVPALMARYAALERVRFDERFELVQLLGALRREDALDGLTEIVWQPLPPRAVRVRCGQTPQRFAEERVRTKAVQGILYLRTEHAYAEGDRVMLEHESVTVRIAAIDAYMWNRDDSRDAATRLYARLPSIFHPYVERPRYHRGMNSEHFETRVLSWMNRWAAKGKLPPNPMFLESRKAHSKPGA